MAENFEITDEMRAVIGVMSEPSPVELTTTSIRAFARGVGYTDPVYFDAEAARAAGYASLPAPPTYLGTAPWVPGKNDPMFGMRLDSKEPTLQHGLAGLLDGGAETFYDRVPVAGETLTVSGGVVGLETKRTGSLGVMLVVTSEAVYRDEAGEIVARTRSNVLFY